MYDLILGAGWPVWPLLALSVLSLALMMERAWFLRERKIAPPLLADAVLTLCQQALPTRQQTQEWAESSMLGQLMAHGVERMRAQPTISDAALRHGLELEGRLLCAKLDQHLSVLGTVSSLATLMGLLGTVVGMIHIFASESIGAQQPAQMAQGISMALYNTALGLGVAIPSLMAWRWLRNRADHLALQLEFHCERLVQQLQLIQKMR